MFWDRCEGPIRYGKNDCCIALADTILAAGGSDLMEGYRGRYRTAIGFGRAFRRAGHETLAAACEAAFRANGKHVEWALNFDVAMVGHRDLGSGRVLGSPAFFHDGFWHVRTERGGAALAANGFDRDPIIWRVLDA